MTIADFGRFLADCLQKETIKADTQIGVFTCVSDGFINIARGKDLWVPPDGKTIVVSQFSRTELLE
ncbi:hypothetical protein ABTM82_19365, partial [Acinetobacter baumannii]